MNVNESRVSVSTVPRREHSTTAMVDHVKECRRAAVAWPNQANSFSFEPEISIWGKAFLSKASGHRGPGLACNALDSTAAATWIDR